MVSEAENNERIDTGNLQHKEDVLRSSDIIPPFNKQLHKVSISQNSGEGAENAEPKKNEIPKFDLAENIMAQQRKITAIRRKSPGGKSAVQAAEPQNKTTSRTGEMQTPLLSEQQQIIAEIVAKDIERLCRSS